jgi:hypothetical protein
MDHLGQQAFDEWEVEKLEISDRSCREIPGSEFATARRSSHV